jgi:tRNA nucleotidyltransferase/poly(A) polymerase
MYREMGSVYTEPIIISKIGKYPMKIEIPENFKNAISILKLINHFGYQARLVGGCVRDAISGTIVNDIDIATTAFPDNIKDIAEAVGLSFAPTGLQHGTVTVTFNDESFEITTLRADVETDGRHAEVRFVEDWEVDASRRDFTFNALSMDSEGNIYDYFGGIQDLQNKKVVFIGNPEDRIQEDYLRILRFFRFCVKYQDFKIDQDVLDIISKHSKSLSMISKERIHSEIWKMNSMKLNKLNKLIFHHMNYTGVSKEIFGKELNYEKMIHFPDHPVLTLYSMGLSKNQIRNLKLSKVENKTLELIDILETTTEHPNYILFKYGPIMYDIARTIDFRMFGYFHLPKNPSPVKAERVMEDFNLKPSKELGEVIKAMEQLWCKFDYELNYEDIKNYFEFLNPTYVHH